MSEYNERMNIHKAIKILIKIKDGHKIDGSPNAFREERKQLGDIIEWLIDEAAKEV